MTNEQISQKANEYGSHEYEQDAFYAGAKWMQEQSMMWVSVEDELPQPGEEVIVYTPHTMNIKVTALARFIPYEGSTSFYWDNSYGRGNVHTHDTVTHWMPLPSPPTAE